MHAGGQQTISVDVSNAGSMPGDEVVQLYLTHEGVAAAPLRALAGFQRVHLLPRQKKTVTFTLQQRDLSTVDDSGVRRIAPGTVSVWIGGGQRDIPNALQKTSGVEAQFTISGDATLPD
jgi:beta-glucosidase